VLVLDMIELLPPFGLNKYDTWRILLVKCYIDNFVRLRSCIRNVNRALRVEQAIHIFLHEDITLRYEHESLSIYFCKTLWGAYTREQSDNKSMITKIINMNISQDHISQNIQDNKHITI
jgi:hypothetical protein